MASSIKDLRENGFTMAELLIVMVIISVLSVGAIGLFSMTLSNSYNERIMSIAQKIENSSVRHPEIKSISTTGDVDYNYFVSNNGTTLSEMPEFNKNTTIKVKNGDTLTICISRWNISSFSSDKSKELSKSYLYDSRTNEVKKEKC